MPTSVKFFTISGAEWDRRTNSNWDGEPLVVGGLYFIDDRNVVQHVTAVTSNPNAVTSYPYGHKGSSTATGASAGDVPLLKTGGKLDNSFFDFIEDGQIKQSYIPDLYLNEFLGTVSSVAALDTDSNTSIAEAGDWALVNGTDVAANGPYIKTSDTWQRIASPFGQLITAITSSSTDAQIPSAAAVVDYVTSAVTGGAVTWTPITDTNSN